MNKPLTFSSACSLSILALAFSACAVDAQDGGSSSVSEEGAAPSTAQAVILAKVELSDTHTVEFLSYPDARMVAVRETQSLDAAEPSLAELGVRADEPLDQVYTKLAGAKADPRVARQLRDVQAAQVAEAAQLEATLDPEISAAHLPDSADSEAETLAVQAPEVGRTQQALCAEPAWDWPGDESWFKSNFCGQNYQYCDTLDAKHSATARSKYLQTVVFNQSHCSTASYHLTTRYASVCGFFTGCTRRTWTLASGTLAPRTYQRLSYAMSGKDANGEWPVRVASITSSQGNYTGLSFFGYTN